MGFEDWSSVAASNSSAAPGIDWAEGQAPGGVNNSARQLMADAKIWQLQHYISVIEHGAVGDGVADDSAAITAAFAASATTKTTVYFPAGTYLCVNVSSTAFVKMVGDGPDTIIKQKDDSAHMMSLLFGCSVHDIVFDGDNQNALGSSRAVLRLGGTTATESVYLERCTIKNVSRFGIWMRQYTQCVIRDCFFTSMLGHGPAVTDLQLFIYNVGALTTSSSVFVVDGCFFTDAVHATPEEGGVGIFVNQTAASARCIITNNRFNNIGNIFAGTGSASVNLYTDCLSTVVSGNIVETYVGNGMSLGGSGEIICTNNQIIGPLDANQEQGIAVTPHSNTVTAHRGRIVVAGNIVKKAGTTGIFITGNAPLGDIFEIIVANNNIADTGTAAGNAGIHMARCGNYTITGNVIRNAGLYGIRTELSAGICAITNNVISDSVDNAIRTSDEDTVASLTCTGNILDENTTGANVIQALLHNWKRLHVADNTIVNTTAAQTGIGITGTTDRLFIGDNMIDLNAGTEYDVNTAALASGADFFTVPSYPYTTGADPNGVITAAYAGQQIKDTGTGTIYIARAAAITVWHSIIGNETLTAPADDTTPSVAQVRYLLIPANTVPTAITQLDDAIARQTVTIILTNAADPSSIADGGNFKLSAAFGPTVDDTITLHTTDGTNWFELSRSAN